MDAPLLEREYEANLARRWRDDEDDDALHQLINSHVRLVVKIASRFRGYGLPAADLIQEYAIPIELHSLRLLHKSCIQHQVQHVSGLGWPIDIPKSQSSAAVETEANRAQLKREKAQRREENLQRIPIEGKFGQGKNGYRLNYIRAKRADTSFAWINSIFLVMNLLVLLAEFLLCLPARLMTPLSDVRRRLVWSVIAKSLPSNVNPPPHRAVPRGEKWTPEARWIF